MNVLIKSARIIAPSNKELHLKVWDLLITEGVIVKIAANITSQDQAVEIVERDNLHLSLGWLDSGVCFGEPGYEERETLENGLNTAALSGFTEVVLNPDNNPLPENAATIVALKGRSRDAATSLYPLGTMTMGSKGIDLAELYDMTNNGAVGFSDFKRPINNANLLKIGLQYTQSFKGLLYSFPLEKSIANKGIVNEGEVSTRIGIKGIPAMAESIQIKRDLAILAYTGGSLHIPTITTKDALIAIKEAKTNGLNVSCSVAIHNLWFTDDVLEEFDTNYKLMPPLRTKEDVEVLREGVVNGTIDMVTSDHNPINIEYKNIEFDNASFGSIGLEIAFPILNNLFGTEMAIHVLQRGRERYKINRPEIKEGVKANITLFNPDKNYVFSKEHILSTSKNTAYLGTELKGEVYGIYNNNRLIIQ